MFIDPFDDDKSKFELEFINKITCAIIIIILLIIAPIIYMS
jgi:hypothetical protein